MRVTTIKAEQVPLAVVQLQKRSCTASVSTSYGAILSSFTLLAAVVSVLCHFLAVADIRVHQHVCDRSVCSWVLWAGVAGTIVRMKSKLEVSCRVSKQE